MSKGKRLIALCLLLAVLSAGSVALSRYNEEQESAQDAEAERLRAEGEIEKDRAEAAARREALRARYESSREGYVQQVFDIVTGKRDE